MKGKRLQKCSLMSWAKSLGDFSVRRVALREYDGVKVSTVFLGLRHGWDRKADLFETMIFGGPHDEICWRAKSRKVAMENHSRACQLVREQ